MARNLQLALQLLARDTGSKVLKQALQGISRDTKAAQKPMMSWRNPASRTQPQRFAPPVLFRTNTVAPVRRDLPLVFVQSERFSAKYSRLWPPITAYLVPVHCPLMSRQEPSLP
jgi:hypothetical protein